MPLLTMKHTKYSCSGGRPRHQCPVYTIQSICIMSRTEHSDKKQLCVLYLKHLFFFNFYVFIYFWLCWVFVSVRGLSLVAASGGYSSSRCAGLSLSRPLLLRGTGSRRAGSVTVAHRPNCSAACGIFPDQGLNPCPLHWQADSQPLRHQGSPLKHLYTTVVYAVDISLKDVCILKKTINIFVNIDIKGRTFNKF